MRTNRCAYLYIHTTTTQPAAMPPIAPLLKLEELIASVEVVLLEVLLEPEIVGASKIEV
jgi:hypothetical protein